MAKAQRKQRKPRKSLLETYKGYLVKFLVFTFPNDYTEGSEATEELLLRITPEDVLRYLNFKAYGKVNPGEEDRPTYARSTTLAYTKKALSKFMPRKRQVWDYPSGKGNPTRSDEVNDMIEHVRRLETRKLGVPPKAVRPLEYGEFDNLLSLARKSPSEKRFFYICAATLQWQTISRVDDLMHFTYDNFLPSIEHPDVIMFKLNWSKNITEERDCPEQFLLPSLDASLDPVLALAVFVETGDVNYDRYLFGEPESCKSRFRDWLQKMIDDQGFKKLKKGNLGTHSLRKGPTTFGARCGLSKDNLDRRGRWRRSKRQVDVYIDNRLPFPDANTAATLCGPRGACFYQLTEESKALSMDDLSVAVAPKCREKFPVGIVHVLTKALLWGVFCKEDNGMYVENQLRATIIQRLQAAGFSSTTNFVKRVPVKAIGIPGGVSFVPLSQGPIVAEASSALVAHGFEQDTSALMAQQMLLQNRLEDINHHLNGEILFLGEKIDKLSLNLRSFMNRPAVVVRAPRPQLDNSPNVDSAESFPAARLSQRPKDLFEVWNEWEFGLRGNKAAKSFTARERGLKANKYRFCRRNIFWRKVKSMIARGHSSSTAIHKIYEVFGQSLPVSSIIKKLRADGNAHPDLI